jgi:hypothetical protein
MAAFDVVSGKEAYRQVASAPPEAGRPAGKVEGQRIKRDRDLVLPCREASLPQTEVEGPPAGRPPCRRRKSEAAVSIYFLTTGTNV